MLLENSSKNQIQLPDHYKSTNEVFSDLQILIRLETSFSHLKQGWICCSQVCNNTLLDMTFMSDMINITRMRMSQRHEQMFKAYNRPSRSRYDSNTKANVNTHNSYDDI